MAPWLQFEKGVSQSKPNKGRVMNTERKLNIRECLIQAIAATQKTLDEIKLEVRESVHHAKSSLQNLHDSSVAERDLNSKIQLYQFAAQKMMMTQKSLRSLEQGVFGQCSCCCEPIESQRLDVAPEAAFCLSCQEVHEKKIKEDKMRFVVTPGLQYMPFLPIVA